MCSCAILIVLGEAVTRSRRRLQGQQRELERESRELMLAQVALRASERREQERRFELEALMDSAPAAIRVAHDAECRCITGNPAASAMLGMPRGANLSRTAEAAERALAVLLRAPSPAQMPAPKAS